MLCQNSQGHNCERNPGILCGISDHAGPLVANSIAQIAVGPRPAGPKSNFERVRHYCRHSEFAPTVPARLDDALLVGTQPNAIVFSAGAVTIAQIERGGFLLNLVGVLLITLFCYLLGGATLGLKF